MGGRGSGGARAGAGRPRRDAQAAWLTGARQAKRGPQGVVPPQAPTDGPTCPKDAPAEVKAVWRDLAPHAIAERTLEPRTVVAFLLLCQNVVLERKLAAAPLTCAGPDHRGILARVEQGFARFRLIPDGKPVPAPVADDEWAEFDGLAIVHGGKA